jgi:excisionase family DNA binding protein
MDMRGQMAVVLPKRKPKPQQNADTGGSASVPPAAAQQNRNADGSASRSPDTEYLSIKQVAALLQVCTKTVHRLIGKLNIPVKRVGRQIRIPASHIELFMTKEW